MKRISLLYILLVVSLLSQSCRKDIDEVVKTPPNIPAITKVISSVHGTVKDGLGNAVPGAYVYFDDETTETDENGVFQFVNKSMNENGTHISVEKDGYFKGSRRVYPSVDNTSLVQIELIPLEYVGNFDSGTSSTIIHNGIVLTFPENAISYEDGSVYNGNVNVAAAFLDPTIPSTLDQMPGDLTGISTEDGLVALKSLGMITVELQDDAGNELQVKSGSLIDVNIPIPSDLRATAPATIPMWHFNEDIGIWEEEGAANLVGDHYETQLAHFSFWNCDIPNDFIFLKGTIVNRVFPIQGVTVMILDNDNNTSGYGVTDENGMFCGFIPNDADLTLIIYNECGDEIYTQNLTTGSEDIVLDPINLFITELNANISGIVTSCDVELSEYSYVLVQNGVSTTTFSLAADGSFTGNIFYCSPGDSIKVSAIDPLNGFISGEYIFTIEGDINVGNIQICEQDFVEHIILEYGDVKWNLNFDDEKLINIFLFGSDVLNVGDEGFIIKSIYEPEPDSLYLFEFLLPFVEGSPFQECQAELIKNSTLTGNAAFGTYSGQLVTYEGIEYLHATGTLTEEFPFNPNELANEPMFFDILIKNIH